MKRVLALLLLTSVLLPVFYGCTSEIAPEESMSLTEELQNESEGSPIPQGSAEQSGPQSGTQQPEPSQVSGIIYPLDNPGGKTIRLWLEVPPMIGPYCEDMAQVAAFRAATEATGVPIVVDAASTAAQEQFQLMMASGSYVDYDVIVNVASMYGSASAAYDDGILIALNDYVDANMPDYSAFLKEADFSKYVTTDDGLLLDIAGLSTGGMAQGTAIRKDWLDTLGLEVPVTYDDYYNVLKAFQTAYGCSEPFLLNSTGFVDNNFLCGGYGISTAGAFGSSNDWYVVENGIVRYSLLSEGFKEYVTMMHKWYTEGLFSDNFLSNVQGAGFSYDSQMLGGDAGIFVTGTDALGTSYAERAEDPNFTVIPIPDAVKNSGDIIKVGITPNSDPVSNRWNVTTGCDNIELVLKYSNWYFTEAGGLACNWGIEGEGFVYVGGEPQYTDLVTNNPDGMMLFVSTAIYTNWNAPYIIDERSTTASFDSGAQREAKKVWNSNRSTENKCYGDLTTDEAVEYNRIFPDINTYASEMTLNFITGNTSIEDGWDTFVSTIESMDIETCLKLRQAAYDRYLKR